MHHGGYSREALLSLNHDRPPRRAVFYYDFRLAGRGRPGSRSAASMMLVIPRTTTSLGDRAFAVAGPRFWNSLPILSSVIRHCRCQSSENC